MNESNIYSYKCRIERIIDGDSSVITILLGFNVELKNQKVRHYKIDTPESYGTKNRDPEEYKFGVLSKNFVEEKLKVGETYTCVSYKDTKGKFGRLLLDFIVYDEQTDSWGSLTDLMIRRRLGVEYLGQSKDDIKDEHLKNREYLYEQGLVVRG
jgi:hypothetical protein